MPITLLTIAKIWVCWGRVSRVDHAVRLVTSPGLTTTYAVHTRPACPPGRSARPGFPESGYTVAPPEKVDYLAFKRPGASPSLAMAPATSEAVIVFT